MKHTLLFLCLLASAACGRQDEKLSSDVKWHTGPGPLRGHEDITRLGIELANQHLMSVYGMKDYFPAVEHGAQGSRTGHDLLQGNYESDFPGETMFSFYQVSPDVNWHDHEELQTVHALRNFPQGQLRNLNDSIRDIRAIITRVTHTALEKFSASDRKGGLYFAGHAVHIIQDSFSPSHAVREDVRSQILRDICTYGKRFAGVCYHKKVAIGDDRVWKENFRCTVNPAERDVTCLKDLAQQAVLATAGYLIVLARLESGQENDRATTLGRYFEDESSSVYSGYFRIEPTFLSGP